MTMLPAKKRVLLVLASFIALMAGPVNAEADRDSFVRFFDSLEGEWRCDLKQYDEAGSVVWESHQRRVFGRYLADRFFTHEAFLTRRDSGEEYRAGVQLISFDDEAQEVILDSFWAIRPGRNDVTIARFSEDFSKILGQASAVKEGQEIRRRYELSVREDGTLLERSYSMNNAGVEFMDHELIYRREE